jgi:hypothetical protein
MNQSVPASTIPIKSPVVTSSHCLISRNTYGHSAHRLHATRAK